MSDHNTALVAAIASGCAAFVLSTHMMFKALDIYDDACEAAACRRLRKAVRAAALCGNAPVMCRLLQTDPDRLNARDHAAAGQQVMVDIAAAPAATVAEDSLLTAALSVLVKRGWAPTQRAQRALASHSPETPTGERAKYLSGLLDPVVRALWSAAMSADSTGMLRLIHEHDISPDTRHPDTSAAPVGRTADVAVALVTQYDVHAEESHRAPGVHLLLWPSECGAAPAYIEGESLLADVAAASAETAARDRELAMTLELLLRCGWPLSTQRALAVLRVLAWQPHKRYIVHRATLLFLLWLGAGRRPQELPTVASFTDRMRLFSGAGLSRMRELLDCVVVANDVYTQRHGGKEAAKDTTRLLEMVAQIFPL